MDDPNYTGLGLYASYLKDWILMDSDCKPRKLAPAAVLAHLRDDFDRGRITSSEFRLLLEIGDALGLDALMTELATSPNNLGFLVFDLAGKKVRCSRSIRSFCNAMLSLLHPASLTAPTP